MKKSKEIFEGNPFPLIVSLPKNSLEFAQAAERGGADALKVHINVFHKAGMEFFKSFEEEKENLKKILEGVKIPVGIVPGAEIMANPLELKEIEEMGFSFYDAFSEYLPLYFLECSLSKMFALSNSFINSGEIKTKIKTLERMGADFFEASIISESDYGKRLTVFDLMNYQEITNSTSKPVFIPTQKKIYPEELKYLKEVSVKGIIIGAIVTGLELQSLEKTTSLFKEAILKLG